MSRFLSLPVLFWALGLHPWVTSVTAQLLVPPPPVTQAGKDAKTGASASVTARCEVSRPAVRCNTRIDWYLPADAVKLARHQSKLLMVLHLSGNFEKEAFT